MAEEKFKIGKELGRFEGETFFIAEHEFGAVYHVYNSMEIKVSSTQTALFETLVDFVRHQDVYSKLEGEEKEHFDLNLSAIVYILSCPLYAFASAEFTYDVASVIVKQLRLVYEKAMEAELQEETPDEDKQFEKATKALEELKKEVENDGSESKGQGENSANKEEVR